MIEISEMYRGNEEVVRADSLQQGIQQGEKITSLKWFLRGQLGFSALVEELGEPKASKVQHNAENFRLAMEKGTPLLEILKQLDEE